MSKTVNEVMQNNNLEKTLRKKNEIQTILTGSQFSRFRDRTTISFNRLVFYFHLDFSRDRRGMWPYI